MKAIINEEAAIRKIEKNRENINEKDVKKVIDKSNKIESTFLSAAMLKRYYTDLKLLLSLIKDYYKGNYTNVPWFMISSIAFALLYVLSPMDAIPDFIPGVGFIDDAAIVLACVKLLEKDLTKYQDWKSSQ